MKWFITRVAILYAVSVLICEAHSFIGWYWPETYGIKYSLWLDKSYHEPLSTVWYLYELEALLSSVIRAYIFAIVAVKVSARLFKISLVFVAYYVTQFGFYLWNRNTQQYSNLIVYLYMILALVFLFIPEKKGKIISMV